MSDDKKLFPTYTYDIALDEGVGPHLVSWISGLMVFFVTLALAANFALSAVSAGWVESLSGSLTVEMGPPLSPEQQKTFDNGVQAVLHLAGQHPAVKSSRLLPRAEITGLVEPWLGRKLPPNLPLPALVDLKLNPGADVARLQKDIMAAAPDAVIDTHDSTLDDVRVLVGTARLFVLLLTCVIAGLAVLTIAGIVRAKFSIHGQEVETLHLLGADDEYIARQFRRHTLAGTLKGAVLGLLGMVIALLAVGYATRTVDIALFPRLALLPGQWLLLIVSPVLAGTMIAHLTAQRAVMKELAKLP